MWMHPTRRLKIGSHVDDCILRGKRKHPTWVWSEVKKKFKIKHWDFVEVGQPKLFCSKLIQKQIDCNARCDMARQTHMGGYGARNLKKTE